MNKILTRQEVTDISEAVQGTIHGSYSGRGMGGQSCVGISTDVSGVVVGLMIGSVLGDTARALMMATASKQDSMGRTATIYYWPGWVLSAADIAALEDEDNDDASTDFGDCD